MNLFSIWLKDMKSFFIWHKELNWNPLFFSKCLKELNLSFIWATFLHDSKNWFFPTWRKDFFKLTQKSWTHFFSMTQRNDLVSPKWRTVLNPSFQHDSKNAILFDWLKKIEPCVKRRVSKSGTFFYSEVKNCFLSFSTWLEELTLFFNMSQWFEPLSWISPTELNLFSIWLKEFWTFQKIWLTELNLFAKKWLKECFEEKSKKWLNELNLSVIRLAEWKLRLDT